MGWGLAGNIRGPAGTPAPTPGIATPAPRVAALTVNAVETVVFQVPILANAAKVGSTVEFLAVGTITGTSPSLLARLRAGTLGTIADAQLCATVAAVMTTGTGWEVHGVFTIRSIGSAGTVIGNVRTLGENLATAQRTSAQSATVALNTTLAQTVSLTLIGGGTSPVLTVVQAHASIPYS